jgi:hypothetical protein
MRYVPRVVTDESAQRVERLHNLSAACDVQGEIAAEPFKARRP